MILWALLIGSGSVGLSSLHTLFINALQGLTDFS